VGIRGHKAGAQLEVGDAVYLILDSSGVPMPKFKFLVKAGSAAADAKQVRAPGGAPTSPCLTLCGR